MVPKIYKPNKLKILRDILIVSALIFAGGFIRAGITPNVFLYAGVFSIGIGLIYMLVMGVLPYVKITNSSEIEYKSDFGVTHKIKLNNIKKITKGSGLGGYEHALFVYSFDTDQMKTTKIKSSYFNREDIIDLIKATQREVKFETNEELDSYLKR